MRNALVCLLVSVACSQQAADGLAHLHGRHVIRYPVYPGWVEHSRYVRHGERRGDRCDYSGAQATQSGTEWVAEEDPDTCTVLRVRGVSSDTARARIDVPKVTPLPAETR